MTELTPGFTLAQLIEKTADELRSLRQKPHPDAVMQFTGCELELAVSLKAEAGGGIKFWLVDASAKASGETVSKVKLTFGPLTEEAAELASRIPLVGPGFPSGAYLSYKSSSGPVVATDNEATGKGGGDPI